MKCESGAKRYKYLYIFKVISSKVLIQSKLRLIQYTVQGPSHIWLYQIPKSGSRLNW